MNDDKEKIAVMGRLADVKHRFRTINMQKRQDCDSNYIYSIRITP